jgi:hypothetical protein
MALATAGLAVLWLAQGGVSILVIGLLLSIVGLGLGLAGSPSQAAALEAVELDRVGMAASTFYTGRYLGGVLGVSVAGAALGVTVTVAGSSLGFGLLTVVGALAVASALGLPHRRSEDRMPTDAGIVGA